MSSSPVSIESVPRIVTAENEDNCNHVPTVSTMIGKITSIDLYKIETATDREQFFYLSLYYSELSWNLV